LRLVLDAGALIALERNDGAVWRRLKWALRVDDDLVTHGRIIGQVWRRGDRQARLSRALTHVRVAPLDEALGRSAGELLTRTRSNDVLDAALVALAENGDQILTSDLGDIERLAIAADRDVDIIPV